MKKLFLQLISVVVVWVFLDQLYFFLKPDKALSGHYNAADIHRKPLPYIAFSGYPNVLDHNKYGYKGTLPDSSFDGLKIAFFGGSTGYQGTPPISEIVRTKLETHFKTKIHIANFSIPSSNHNQHLHNLIETNKFYKPDFVIFYGGFNELIQPLEYDPRPGYPYNYFFRNDTPPFYRFLLENSPTAFQIYRKGMKDQTQLTLT